MKKFILCGIVALTAIYGCNTSTDGTSLSDGRSEAKSFNDGRSEAKSFSDDRTVAKSFSKGRANEKEIIGVPKWLANERSANLSDIHYSLHFDIPESKEDSIPAHEIIRLSLSRRGRIILDAKDFYIANVIANGKSCRAEIANEHIIIPRKYTRKGTNILEIGFTAGEQSLNRRSDFLYTLLVPDRARTLFPCFDQPDLKAGFCLDMNVPEGWTWISNTDPGRETEPLSTYLFAFAAGRFECVTSDRISAGGRPVSLYHRETDPTKIAQCSEILNLVGSSLDYLEKYTGVDYPFAKYDLVVLPDFQYGGMEHTGATFYNDRRLFLGPAPTTEELLGRASLIAHETAHMWFGDYVTMKWFDDVWTKEVFANWFAAKMIQPLFPNVNHRLGNLSNYYAAAYSEDRTIGSNAIQRPLDNLNNAGLIYCNIIYDKAPVVMEMLARRIGDDAFRRGIQEYVHRFAYGNASWDDLIDVLYTEAVGYETGEASTKQLTEQATTEDNALKEWSRIWIKEKGMPTIEYELNGDGDFCVNLSDPFNNGNIWQQDISFCIVYPSGKRSLITLPFKGETSLSVNISSIGSTASGFGSTVPGIGSTASGFGIVPNSDGLAYGYFKMKREQADLVMKDYHLQDETCRMASLINLYENVRHHDLAPEVMLYWLCESMPKEANSLIISSMMKYGADLVERVIAARQTDSQVTQKFEDTLVGIITSSGACEAGKLAYRTLYKTSRHYNDFLFADWRSGTGPKNLILGESDLTAMSYQLMLRFPERYSEIRELQAERIGNPDRKEAFLEISAACSPKESVRDSVFNRLLSAEGRDIESRATAALSLLNSPLREQESIKYIRPALDIIEDVQRDGDIFFPTTWCSALLGGHYSVEATNEVLRFISENENRIEPLLMTKIKQKSGLTAGQL